MFGKYENIPTSKVCVIFPAPFTTKYVYQASLVSPYVNFCVQVHRPNHYIQLTLQFSVFLKFLAFLQTFVPITSWQ